MEEQTSKDIQKYIYERDHFIKKYMTKRDNEIFKPLRFDVSAKVIQNITADTDKWDRSFSKIEKIVNFNLTHLSHSLMYILMKNLGSFIGNDSGTVIAQFVMDVFDMIFKDMEAIDFTRNTFILGDYRTQESKAEEEELEKKSETVRMIDELEYKFRKISKAKEDFEEAFEELEEEDEKLTAKERFIKEYKEKHDKDPTESEIMDYVDEQEKEKEADENEDQEEFIMKEDSDNEDALEKGAGYGEMPQGGEGEDGDF
jgi:predicted ribosome quality control (RQC) complex YloA/Tae2 family protein